MTCQYCHKEFGYHTFEHEKNCSKRPIQGIIYLDYNNLTRIRYAFDTKKEYSVEEIEDALKDWFNTFSIQITYDKIKPLQKKQERKVQQVVNERIGNKI